VAPGLPFDSNVTISIYNTFDKEMPMFNNSFLVLEPITPDLNISEPYLISQNGKFTFSNLIFGYYPGATGQIRAKFFSPNRNSPQKSSSTDIIFELNFRNCS